MDLNPKSNTVPNAFFRDVGSYRTALGKTDWDAQRFYELAVIVETSGNNRTHHHHVFVYLSEYHLFVMRPGKSGTKKDAWSGKQKRDPIPLHHILDVCELWQKKKLIFSSDRTNSKVRRFQIKYEEMDTNGNPHEQSLELATWEDSSLLFEHIYAAWLNVVSRKCLDKTMKIQFDDPALMAQLLDDIHADVRKMCNEDLEACSEILFEFNDAAFCDRELKRVFFAQSEFTIFLIHQLEQHILPSERFTRNTQLQYCVSILKLFRSMLFNSESLGDRSMLLKLPTVTIVDLLTLLGFSYSDSGVAFFEKLRRTHFQANNRKSLYSEDSANGDDDNDDDHVNEFSAEELNDPLRLKLLRSITECQISLFNEFENLIAFTVTAGVSRLLTSETLATLILKGGFEFTKYTLPRFLLNLMSLIREWDADTTDLNRIPSLSQQIFENLRLINALCENYDMLDDLLLYCDEELTYYLMKKDFTKCLDKLPRQVPNRFYVEILNLKSKVLLAELASRINNHDSEKQIEKEEKGVFLL